MSEKLKDVRLKPVPIELDKARTVFYDFNAYAELEEQFGSLDKMFKRIEKPTLRDLQILLWAGLLHELPDPVIEDGKNVYYDDDEPFTVRKVGKILHGINDLAKINLAVFAAIAEAMPQGKQERVTAEEEKTE
jgi:hypothetical protein